MSFVFLVNYEPGVFLTGFTPILSFTPSSYICGHQLPFNWLPLLVLLHHDNPPSHTGPICEGSCAMWPSCGCRGLQWPMCAVCVDCLLCPWTVTGLLSVTRRWPRGHGAQRGLSWWPLYWSLIWGWLTTPRDREKCVWALFWGDQIH